MRDILAILRVASHQWRWMLGGVVLGVAVIAANTLLLVMIRRGAVARTAALLYLMPPLVALQAWAAFGEHLDAVQLGGMAVAVLGVALVTRRAGR